VPKTAEMEAREKPEWFRTCRRPGGGVALCRTFGGRTGSC